jgi:TonB family protein
MEGAIHQRLAAAAERCYPPAARRFRQVGTASVRFCVTGEGGVEEEHLQVSSGVSLLDAAAMSCVIPNAVPFPALAASHCFEVPVRFGR